jgi:ribosomal protein S12 methylthiotransferase accessory factor
MILGSTHGDLACRLPIDGAAAYAESHADAQQALLDLARLGFVQPVNTGSSATVWHWNGRYPASDRALLALLAQFDLHLEVGLAADETVWIAAAIPENVDDNARQAFSGTGFEPADAVRTCLGEFAEFQSWIYRPGDERTHCDRGALGGLALDPWSVLGFTQGQCKQWSAFNTSWQGYDSIPAPHAFDGEIDWAAARALRDATIWWIPAQLCFGQYGKHAACTDKDWHGDSNGCAAGPTYQQALAHALLELAERDATGIWWYGGVRRPAVPRSLLEQNALGQALVARERIGQTVHLLDLTHDLAIPVVAAILTDEDESLLSLGFGCHPDCEHAVRSAYREMCQMELSILFAKRRVAQAGDAARPEDRRLLDWLSTVGCLPHLRPDAVLVARQSPDFACDDRQTVELVHDRLSRAGLEAYVVDLQRPDIGVPAVRAFVPGLCHFKPRLGFKRLVDVPRTLRWRDARFNGRDLSDLPLLL